MDELDGVNRLVFNGPFSGFLSDEKKTEVRADKLVIVSKNGSVANLPAARLKTIKQKALDLYWQIVQPEKTPFGVERALGQGAVLLEEDLYWLKSETTIKPIIIRVKEESKSIQELKELFLSEETEEI